MDTAIGTTVWTVERYSVLDTLHLTRLMGREPLGEDFKRLGYKSYKTDVITGNLITNAGWTRLMSLLTNQSATQALDATHTRIGVGNSSTAEAYTDTDLIASAGSTNRWFQPVTGAGTLGTRTLAFSTSFASADGNFAWNEFGIDVTTATATATATIGALLFNRKAGIAQGTKALGQVWTTTATITFT